MNRRNESPDHPPADALPAGVLSAGPHETAPAGLGALANRPADWAPENDQAPKGRSRSGQQAAVGRIRRDGKFFRVCAPAGEVGAKFFPKGFTYGPFEPGDDGQPLPTREDVRRDFEQIAAAGGTVVRVYHTPPTWLLDLATELGLRVLVDVAWAKNLVFTDDRRVMAQARRNVRRAAQACGQHPAVFAISVANEIPAEVVRYAGAAKVENFIDDLIKVGKRHAPDCLFTFANFPSTEFLRPRRVDFLTFNVYLHEETAFRNYLGRLQSLAGELPLVLGEYGIDTIREADPEAQAERLEGHIRAVFDEGLAGAIVFSFTDDWFVHGYQMAGEWNFGVTHGDRDEAGYRRAKPALEAVGRVFAEAPHTARVGPMRLWDELPKVSVIVCSYNGASTVESCLASMERLNYPDYEVIFVDDGSTDHTQDILRNFKSVRNIVQTNHGLSFARNIGMKAARGEIIVYTDSDCEADEDWLYYAVLNLLRTGHIGMGGPNLIPDEGSATAECVGLSPGGPTHVMLDDKTAEHVPGCNMAFWRHAALEINGFDTQYTKAGDDVDFIWRLQDRGYTIGFAPSAQVWHYRRNSVKAYLKQQRGYGEAEAMLQFKHPDRFNTLGASLWHGRIYGPDGPGGVELRLGGDIIYHGAQGTGLFQTIYKRPSSMTAMMLMSIEWHLLAGFVATLGIAFPMLLLVALGMELIPIAIAVAAAWQQPEPRHKQKWSRALIAYLHWRQPITRGWARYTVRLRGKTAGEGRFRRSQPLPVDPRQPGVLKYWWGNLYAEDVKKDRFALTGRIEAEARAAKIPLRADSGWSNWDLELYGSRFAKARVLTTTEHHEDGNLVKTRVTRRRTGFAKVLQVASLTFAIVTTLALSLTGWWPVVAASWIAPGVVWLTYRFAGRRLQRRVMNLVDLAAEREGFFGVFASPQPVAVEADATEHENVPVDAMSDETEDAEQSKPVPALA